SHETRVFLSRLNGACRSYGRIVRKAGAAAVAVSSRQVYNAVLQNFSEARNFNTSTHQHFNTFSQEHKHRGNQRHNDYKPTVDVFRDLPDDNDSKSGAESNCRKQYKI